MAFKITKIETGQTTVFECLAEFSFHVGSHSIINFNLVVKSPDMIPFGDNFNASISVDSEWLGFKADTPTKIKIHEFNHLEITEDNRVGMSPSFFTGDYADELSGDESSGRIFYYYVSQPLEPLRSTTILDRVDKTRYRFQHKAEIDFYKIEIDSEMIFTGVTAMVWKLPEMENDPAQAEKDVLARFNVKFDSTEFESPTIKETDRTKTFCFKPKV